MKRVVLLSVLIVYVLLTAGVQLHLHYCCGHLSDFHFISSSPCEHNSDQEKNDTCCGKKHCCSYVHIDLKVDDSHQPSETARFIPVIIEGAFAHSFPILIHSASRCDTPPVKNAPPPDDERYLRFHSLVLYA
ncbi:MAG: HYC_CC_PP family protein [Flavobacteriales bacterium]